jgi:hypothetical protein
MFHMGMRRLTLVAAENEPLPHRTPAVPGGYLTGSSCLFTITITGEISKDSSPDQRKPSAFRCNRRHHSLLKNRLDIRGLIRSFNARFQVPFEE